MKEQKEPVFAMKRPKPFFGGQFTRLDPGYYYSAGPAEAYMDDLEREIDRLKKKCGEL